MSKQRVSDAELKELEPWIKNDHGMCRPGCGGTAILLRLDLIDARARIAELEAALTTVRDQLLDEGYHRPNETILAIDEALEP